MTELQILYSLILDRRNIEIYLFFLQSWKLNWAELIFFCKKLEKPPIIENFKSVLLVWLNGLLLFYKFVYRGLIMSGFSSIFWQKRFSIILIRFLSKNMSGTDLIKFKNSIFQIDYFENLTCNVTWYSNFSLLHIGKLVWISMYLSKFMSNCKCFLISTPGN